MQRLQPNIDFEEYAGGRAFGDMKGYSQESIALLWQKAKSVCTEANLCEDRRCDENAWNQDVVLPVLGWKAHTQHHTPETMSFSRIVNM